MYVLSRVLFISISGFILGYDVGSINGVKDMKGYRQALNLSYLPPSVFGGGNLSESCDSQDDVDTSAILGLIVSLYSVGGLIGALISGVLSDLMGRKPAVIVGASMVAFSGVLHTGAVHLGFGLITIILRDLASYMAMKLVEPLTNGHVGTRRSYREGVLSQRMALLSRIICGIGVGILYQVTPLYVGEISPENLRGRLLSILNVYGTFGYFVATILNVIVQNYVFGWRISVGVPFLAGTTLALGMLLLPRSPRWLVKKSREDEALKILAKIYKDEDRVKSHLLAIKSTVTLTKEPFLATLKYICQWKFIQRLFLGFFILILGRFVGGNFLTYFSVSIFCGIGLPGFALTIAIAIANFGGMIASLTIIDKLGRKPLFLMLLLLMLVSHIISVSLIFAFHLEDTASDGPSVAQKVAGYFVAISVCLFLASFTASCGSIPWIIVSEIFPLEVRGFMISICNTGFWLGIIIVNQLGPILITSPLRISGTLLLFSSIILFMLFYILLLIPETKGYTLEEVEILFSKPWLKRTNVLYYLRCGCFWDLVVRRRVDQSEEAQRLNISMEQLSLSSSSSSLDEENVDSTKLTTSE